MKRQSVNIMKKLTISLLALLTLGFASCEDDWTEATPQVNPQEALIAVDDIMLTSTLPEAINLQTAYMTDNKVRLFTDSVKNLPAGSQIQYELQFSKTEDFASYGTLPVSVESDTAFVRASDFETAYVSNIGRSPKAKDIYLRYAAYIVKDETSTVRVGDPNTYIGATRVNITPYPSDLVIEENYYLLGIFNGWSVAEAIKFNHTGDPYENPIFTIKVDISKEAANDGWWWKIVPESTYKNGNWVSADNAAYGVAENGSEEAAGMLVARTAETDCGAGCLKMSGELLLTINMEEGTYSFIPAAENLYTPGQSNGWKHAASQMLYTNNYSDYMGFAYLDASGFKFSNAPDWDHTNYGLSTEAEGKLNTAKDAGNLAPKTTGLYWCNANIAALTYSLYEVTTIGIVGDATPGKWDASTALQPVDDKKLVWEGEFTFAGSGEWKFRANNDWKVNLGGSLDNLVYDGGNMPTPGAGTYKVKLDLTKLPYTATVTAVK